MSTAASVDTDAQLARLLQIGAVLEEVVEARAHRHYRTLPASERDESVEALLSEAASESAEHRRRLEELVDELNAEGIPVDQIETLVEEQYSSPGDFDGVLYDQLNGEETAYKFYDDLITAIEDSEAEFSIDRKHVLATLEEIREQEARGVEEIAKMMEERSG